MIKCDKSKPLHNLRCAWRSASFTAGNNTRPHFFTAGYCVSPSTVVCTGIKNPMKQTISSPASRNGRRGKEKNIVSSVSMFYQVGIFSRIISNLFRTITVAMTHGYNLLPSNCLGYEKNRMNPRFVSLSISLNLDVRCRLFPCRTHFFLTLYAMKWYILEVSVEHTYILNKVERISLPSHTIHQTYPLQDGRTCIVAAYTDQT